MERTLGQKTSAPTQTYDVKNPAGRPRPLRRTFQVFVQDVLKAVEDGFVVRDLAALAGVRPLLPALEVGVDFTRVGGVLLVMGHLQTESRARVSL